MTFSDLNPLELYYPAVLVGVVLVIGLLSLAALRCRSLSSAKRQCAKREAWVVSLLLMASVVWFSLLPIIATSTVSIASTGPKSKAYASVKITVTWQEKLHPWMGEGHLIGRHADLLLTCLDGTSHELSVDVPTMSFQCGDKALQKKLNERGELDVQAISTFLENAGVAGEANQVAAEAQVMLGRIRIKRSNHAYAPTGGHFESDGIEIAETSEKRSYPELIWIIAVSGLLWGLGYWAAHKSLFIRSG